jgi:hypothetical protein
VADPPHHILGPGRPRPEADAAVHAPQVHFDHAETYLDLDYEDLIEGMKLAYLHWVEPVDESAR